MFNLQWNSDLNQHPGDITALVSALQQVHDLMDAELAQVLDLHQEQRPLESAWIAAWERLGLPLPVRNNTNFLWTLASEDLFTQQFVDTGRGVMSPLPVVYPGMTEFLSQVFSPLNATVRVNWATTDIMSTTVTVRERSAWLVMRFRCVFQHDSLDVLTRIGWYYSVNNVCPGLLASGHVGTLAAETTAGGIIWLEKRGTPATIQFDGHEFIWRHPTLLTPGNHTIHFGFVHNPASNVVQVEPDAIALHPSMTAEYPVQRLEGEWELIYE